MSAKRRSCQQVAPRNHTSVSAARGPLTQDLTVYLHVWRTSECFHPPHYLADCEQHRTSPASEGNKCYFMRCNNMQSQLTASAKLNAVYHRKKERKERKLSDSSPLKSAMCVCQDRVGSRQGGGPRASARAPCRWTSAVPRVARVQAHGHMFRR